MEAGVVQAAPPPGVHSLLAVEVSAVDADDLAPCILLGEGPASRLVVPADPEQAQGFEERRAEESRGEPERGEEALEILIRLRPLVLIRLGPSSPVDGRAFIVLARRRVSLAGLVAFAAVEAEFRIVLGGAEALEAVDGTPCCGRR